MHHVKRYRINRPNVVHEVMGGEAVIVNLDSGSYYSSEGTGATIWNVLDQGATVPHILAAIHRHHTHVPNNVEEVISQWMEHLQAENLVASEPLIDGSHTGEVADDVNGPTPDKTPFKEPTLEKYTDMEDLLLLDPIHDVKDGAWPQIQDTKAS